MLHVLSVSFFFVPMSSLAHCVKTYVEYVRTSIHTARNRKSKLKKQGGNATDREETNNKNIVRATPPIKRQVGDRCAWNMIARIIDREV